MTIAVDLGRKAIKQKKPYKLCRHATYPATGYFQCKENHFETRPFHAKFKIGKEMPKIESEKPIYNVNQGP